MEVFIDYFKPLFLRSYSDSLRKVKKIWLRVTGFPSSLEPLSCIIQNRNITRPSAMLFKLCIVKGHFLEDRKCYRRRFWHNFASYFGSFLLDLGMSM
jgi:hypothetical protein